MGNVQPPVAPKKAIFWRLDDMVEVVVMIIDVCEMLMVMMMMTMIGVEGITASNTFNNRHKTGVGGEGSD